MNQEHHQARILLAIVRRQWADAEELVALAPPDPRSFLACCRESDIHPWVHTLLTGERQTELVGPEIMTELSRLRDKVRRDNILLLARAEQALDLLLGAGVVPVALKGLDLLHRVYDSFDQRTIDDVDLLLRPEDLGTALRVLDEAGWQLPDEPRRTHYIRSSHHIPMRSPGPPTVDFELHWNLAQEVRYAIDGAELIKRALPLDVGGRKILRLTDDDLVAHLLVHHFSHYFDRRLKWLVDLQMLVAHGAVDWNAVAERIRGWGGVAASGISAVHLHKLDPRAVPAEALGRLPVAGWRRALTSPLRSTHPLELFRGTRRRAVQLYLAAVMLERPSSLPSWLMHRSSRDSHRGANPLESDPVVYAAPDRSATHGGESPGKEDG